jgi:Uma2 family endonuclease
MRNRLSPVIVRGLPLGLPTAEEIARDPARALKRLPRGDQLPYDDGEPMETPWYRWQMNLLIETLTHHWKDRKDVFIGGNMFLYFNDSQEFNRDFRGPDFFVVNGGVDGNKERYSWIAWDEFGRLPDLIIELMSKSTAKIDRGEKLHLYTKRFRVHEYFIYDPETETLEGWRRTAAGKYAKIEPEDGRMWSGEVGLYLAHWDGTFIRRRARWLRFFTEDGKLVPTEAEHAAGATQLAQDAVKAAEKKLKSIEEENARLKRELAALRKKRKS